MVYHLLNAEHISEKTGCGCTYFRGPDNICLPHNHEFYELVLTDSENVIHEIGAVRTELPKYALMLIRPHDTHRFVDEGQGEFSYLNLAFTTETFDDIVKYLNAENSIKRIIDSENPPYAVLSAAQGVSIKNQFLCLMGDSTVPEPKVYSRALIASVFSKYFFNNIESADSTDIPPWFNVLCAEMNKIENLTLTTDEMSKLSGRSYSHICYCFQKYLNTSPTKYINDIKLKYAKNMILHTNMTVLDVAYECGFENMGYFHRLFKKKFGISPGEMRKLYNIDSIM